MSPRNSLLLLIFALAIVFSPMASTLAQTPVASPAATPVAEAPSFREDECAYDLPDGLTADDVRCGWVTAPMYPDGKKEGVVQLPIMRILATTDTPAAEPLLILLGGPGQNMSAVTPMFSNDLQLWNFMLERQDVILFDQRGMGASMPTLACPFERATGESGAAEAGVAVGFALMRCPIELAAEGTDLSAFTTEANAADIEAIRVAMGYEQVDLYGISYGSKLALSAIRDYPDSIRASIIASPLPLETNPFYDQVVGFESALDQIWAACLADTQCAADNPDPEGSYLAAVERLQTEPMSIEVMVPGTEGMTELPVDHYTFMQLLYLGVFVGPLAPMLPYLVTEVAAGEDAVLQVFAPFAVMSGGLSNGALFTYFCQDEVPFASSKDTNKALAAADLSDPIDDGTFISLGDQSYQICGIWKLKSADPIENEAVVSDEPLLIMTGSLDPITPPGNGDVVAANFPNSQLVEFTAQGHDPASNDPECGNALITQFLDDPTAQIDAACASDPIEFYTYDEIFEPLATPVATPIPDGV